MRADFYKERNQVKKDTGESVAKDMRKARDAKNERLFSMEEFLTPQQITSYFSRFTAKRKQLNESEIEAAELEALQKVREDIMIALQQDSNRYLHPIVHKGLQLCEMSKDELSLLRMTTLKAICKEYELQVSGRRKQPYVDCVISLVMSCTCKLQKKLKRHQKKILFLLYSFENFELHATL